MNEQTIFSAALERDPGERSTFLDGACGTDQELRARVQKLIGLHENAGNFLARPAAGTALTIDQPLLEKPGTQIGPYKLLEQIGEGAFGIVYMAEQTAPVRRKVALKVLKLGMDTRQVIARFEAERQALALMDHPHIAKVFDGGETASGRPYFVMELVKGIPITDYCDERQLTPRERLELFVTVCHAVQHAHQKGIIHRDIKPSNVLVTLLDDRPIVKVIDFGIAKATGGQQLTDKTVFTGFAQLVGTPLYMSPEQAALSAVDVDTRSDIYSLGVLLYELLTGTTPLDKSRLQEMAYDEIRRIIQDEEPPRPSARISTLRNARTTRLASGHANRMPSAPASLGELDWIVMKALEKDRNRRYESAGALARDIERYLRDEPVQACPPSNWYRFRKFARRNKSVLATASVVGLAVVVLATSLVRIAFEQQARQTAEQARVIEQQARQTAEQRQALAEDEGKKAFERERRESYFHRITLAHRDLALDLLAACPEDLHDWEWHYLMRLCRVDPLVLRDKTAVNGVAFSSDGASLASAGGDGFIKIWNSRTGDVVQKFRAHSNSVVSVAFHPDGKHLASVGADQQMKVWDLTIGQVVFTHPCDVVRKFGTAYTVAFSPDGRHVAAVSEGVARIWDWQKGQLVHAFPHEDYSIPVAFSSDGARLATGGNRREGHKLWDAEAGGPPLCVFPAHRHPVNALAFSPDDKWLASASFDKSVKLWDTKTGALLHTLLHTGAVDCVAFSLDGRRLASAGEDRVVRIWDSATGREVLGLRGHTGRCGCVAFSPDGLRLASASKDGTIRFWDATPLREDERQEILTLTQHTDGILSVAYSPIDQRIASAGYDAVVKVWDAATGEVSAEFTGHALVVFGVAWHPDGERIASAGSDGPQNAVKVWDSRNPRDVFPISDWPERLVFAVAFSPDGRHLVTGKIDGAVQVWDARTGEGGHPLFTHAEEVRGLVFSPDSKHLASASGDGLVYLWDATRLDETQEPRPPLQARVPGPGVNVAFSPDGRRLATGGEDNTVIIWDVETGERLQTLEGEHSREVYALAFSPDDDGRWIASAGEDRTVKVWNSHTGKLVHTFRGHTGLVTSLAFSPDGRRLVSGSRDTTVKVWDMTKLNEVAGR